MESPFRLRNPKAGTEFRRLGDFLALYHAARDQDAYWAGYWRGFDFGALQASPGFSALGELAGVFRQYLTPGFRVVEAGCGAGRVVAALKAEGLEVVGFERSALVVDAVRSGAGFLDVRRGDVENLDLDAESVEAYISLGVIEHNQLGPQKALEEAARVLVPGGVALVSVPYLNPQRNRHLERLREDDTSDLGFHQYYFGVQQLDQALAEAGFLVKDHFPYAIEGFLTREHAMFSRFWRSSLCRQRIKRPIRSRLAGAGIRLRWRFAHMLLAVGVRT